MLITLFKGWYYFFSFSTSPEFRLTNVMTAIINVAVPSIVVEIKEKIEQIARIVVLSIESPSISV